MSLSDFGHDHVGVDSPKRVLLLGEKNIVLDTCSLALEEKGFCVIRSDNQDAAGAYAFEQPEVIIMESDERMLDLLKLAPEIIAMKPETHIVVLPEKTAVVSKETKQIGIGIFLRRQLFLESFLAKVEAILNSKLPYMTIDWL